MSSYSMKSSILPNNPLVLTTFPSAPSLQPTTRSCASMASPRTTTNYTCASCSVLGRGADPARHSTKDSRNSSPSWTSGSSFQATSRPIPMSRARKGIEMRHAPRTEQLRTNWASDEEENEERHSAKSMMLKMRVREPRERVQSRGHRCLDYRIILRALARGCLPSTFPLDRRKEPAQCTRSNTFQEMHCPEAAG